MRNLSINNFIEKVDGFVSSLPLPWWVWAILVAVVFYNLTVKPSRHAWRIRKASKILSKLKKIGVESGAAAQFGYLRSKSVDPFTFEEAILTALHDKKIKIRRNKRYTGDGGIDGRCWINGKQVLIQAKLYKGHITPQHVRDFVSICRRKRAYGLFVHSGKTGPASREHKKDDFEIVSGDVLLRLLCGGPVKLFGSDF